MKSLLCLLALLPFVLGNLSSRYAFSSTLYDRNGDTYVLHWTFNNVDRTIAFAVNVSTTGWVGFGISPNGGMVNSDVVMGWVSNGRTYFHVSSTNTHSYVVAIWCKWYYVGFAQLRKLYTRSDVLDIWIFLFYPVFQAGILWWQVVAIYL